MRKILFIDDNTSLRELTIDALKLEGFEAFGAETGQQGINLAKSTSPDLILCDILMPDIDGYEVLRQMKAYKQTSLIPFIFLSALSERTNVRQGMNLGAEDFLVKPVSLEELVDTIHTRLRKTDHMNIYIESLLNDLRERITNVMPHEFLTPLNAILGCAGIIKENANNLSRNEIREIAATIEEGGNRLHDLIRSYINHALVTSKKNLNPEEYLIDHLDGRMSRITNLVAEKYKRKQDLILNLENASISMDPDDFDFLVRELSDNAFKFSKAKSHVIVSSKVDNHVFEIRIIDHGIGFPIDTFSDIEAFNQFNREKHEQQGSGLGLITALLITERYNGKLKITNDIQGTTVILVLPLR